MHELEIEVFSTGQWNGDVYSDDDLFDIVNNFDLLKDTIKPPLKLGHNEAQMKDIIRDGQPALGWVSSLKKAGSKLVATLSQVPDVVYKAIKSGLYKRVSSEIYWNYKQGGTVHKRVFAGLALLGADLPAVTNLADLEAYMSMVAAPCDRVCTYVFESDKAETINDYQEVISTMEDNDKKIYADKIAALEAQVNLLTPEADKAKTYAAELEVLRRETGERKKAAQYAELKTFCDNLVVEGRLMPATRERILDAEKMTYSDESGYSIGAGQLMDILKTFAMILPLTEKGEEIHKPTYATVAAELDAKAHAYVSDKKVTYREAVQAILATDKELSSRYIDEIPILD